MEAFGLYLIKSMIWLTGFALVFILFLRNERFFFLNRIYLLSGILTSFFFPLISVHYTVILPVVGAFQVDSAVADKIQTPAGSIVPYLKMILMVFYTLGVLFVLTLIFRQGRAVIRAIKRAEIIPLNPIKLIRTPDYTSAFSFFSYVFVNPSITDIETKEIMNHELVHIRQKHWIDLVLVQLLCMIQWFNPIVWIYVRFIRQNHEYLADEVALQRTSDPAIYRAALLNQIVGASVVSLSNSFNYSLNKKRFNMMKNIISSPYRKLKILLILPVFAIVLYAFAKPDYKYQYSDKSSDNMSQSPGTQTMEVKGTVINKEEGPLPGAIITLKGTTIGTITDDNGSFMIGNVSNDAVLVVSFVGFKSKVVKPDFKAPMRIEMVRDTLKYSDLNISTPPPPPPPPPLPKMDANNSNTSVAPPPPPPPPPAESGIRMEGGKKPLIVVDGLVSDIDINKIDPETIESMKVMKDEYAKDRYGDKGKDGVIEITTKKKTDKDTIVAVEELPEFIGGKDAMAAWLVSNLKYPGEAVKAKITGKVLVSFLVTAKGKINNAVVIKSVSPVLNAEAVRVISSMPDWKPGMQAGKYVPVQMQVPVEFKLN